MEVEYESLQEWLEGGAMQEERRDQSEEARIARLKWSLLRQGYLLELQPWNKVFKQEYEATLDEYSRVLEKVEVLNGMD